jgi:hypothetical protein
MVIVLKHFPEMKALKCRKCCFVILSYYVSASYSAMSSCSYTPGGGLKVTTMCVAHGIVLVYVFVYCLATV